MTLIDYASHHIPYLLLCENKNIGPGTQGRKTPKKQHHDQFGTAIPILVESHGQYVNNLLPSKWSYKQWSLIDNRDLYYSFRKNFDAVAIEIQNLRKTQEREK